MNVTTPPPQTLISPNRAEQVAARLADAGDAETAAFARLCLRAVPLEDLADYDDPALTAAVRAFDRFAAERPADLRKLRIYNPNRASDGYDSPNTIIETLGTDTPFLVDSCLAALNARDMSVKALWHPVIGVTRDRAGNRIASAAEGSTAKESLIRIEIDRMTAPAHIEALEAELRQVFVDVALAVRDWKPMVSALDEIMETLRSSPPPIPPDDVAEALAFLSWLKEDHFTFLGCRDYDLYARNGDQTLEMRADSGLGLLSDPERRIVRRGADRTSLRPELRAFLNEPVPLVITKANTRSTVHRRVHMDYIGIKRFAPDGLVLGERRFVGLFTSAAYTRHTREIPYLRRKVQHMVERAGFDPLSHDGKAYLNVLETFPRDELFQVTEDELFAISLGILRLRERPRTKVFLRWDKFDRFVSVLVFMPRESYSTNVRIRIMEILATALKGVTTAYYPAFGDDPLARVHYILRRNEGERPEVDVAVLEADIARAARTWDEDFETAAAARFGEEDGARLYATWRHVFGAGYREDFDAAEALEDIAAIKLMRDRAFHVRLYRAPSDVESVLRLKIYHSGGRLVLSDVLPMLERMGLRIQQEQSYPLSHAGARALVVHDFLMQEPQGRALVFDDICKPFEEAFTAVWNGLAESDGLNRLVVRAGLGWRDVTVLRAIARFLRQAAIPYSLDYMEEALGGNPAIAKLIVDLFHARFDPAREAGRTKVEAALRDSIESALEQVSMLDEDRILRRFSNAVDAMRRTTFYRIPLGADKTSVLAFKIASRAVLELPEPRPMAEIFLYSPRVEGIHLRFGKVARGGIRWSDRREDFRTEILGLVKAQRVKNAVIVPVGAKGGFVLKQLPADASRETQQAEAIDCYKIFITALLDLTDNFERDVIVPPPKTVRHDDDDPYLVVAADKGTASFSDIANAIAQERGFWLGDAFASGGSQGYDHKKMGITARGAWEAVKRHFRELGKDIQTEPFTVVGVGDMSGDVFGNAMLLSRQIRLVAAFDHRDIFIDPDPDVAKSYAERARLFDVPRSSWADYDRTLISQGGGVFSRRLKAISLSPEMKALSGLSANRVTPADFIRALLKADVDLLWFGGIGTFVKASNETHLDAGDRANDALRIDGVELRARVIGEGANLGCTQRGRIEYARHGGRINTDAIDNSAGVDTSDHEVNIKILLDAEVRAGAHAPEARQPLLEAMTDEVTSLVLATNYAQTLALSISEATAAHDVGRQRRFIELLERDGVLDRALERLPDRETMRQMEAKGVSLTRPELAVLLAYAKMTLFDALLESDVPDDSHFDADLAGYFPSAIRQGFASAVAYHRLRREIISTLLAGQFVDRAGPTFIATLAEETERPIADVMRAAVIARSVSGLDPLYAAVNALDNQVPASLQTELHLELKRHLQHHTLWFLREGPRALAIEETITRFLCCVELLKNGSGGCFSPAQRAAMEARRTALAGRGVPASLAAPLALLEPFRAAGDLVLVSEEAERPIAEAARAFFTVGELLGLDRLLVLVGQMKVESQWDERARRRLLADISSCQRVMAARALRAVPDEGASGEAAALAWLDGRRGVEPFAKMVSEFEQSGLSIPKLAVTGAALRDMAAA